MFIARADIKINLDYEENDEYLSKCSLSSLESSSSSSSSQNNLQETNEEDRFIYLCGWLVRKFKNKYPYLGNYTKDNKLDHSYSTSSWLQNLSYGGLTEPTADWVMKAKNFENMFKKFHKDKISTEPNIGKRLTNLIKNMICLKI